MVLQSFYKCLLIRYFQFNVIHPTCLINMHIFDLLYMNIFNWIFFVNKIATHSSSFIKLAFVKLFLIFSKWPIPFIFLLISFFLSLSKLPRLICFFFFCYFFILFIHLFFFFFYLTFPFYLFFLQTLIEVVSHKYSYMNYIPNVNVCMLLLYYLYPNISCV